MNALTPSPMSPKLPSFSVRQTLQKSPSVGVSLYPLRGTRFRDRASFFAGAFLDWRFGLLMELYVSIDEAT